MIRMMMRIVPRDMVRAPLTDQDCFQQREFQARLPHLPRAFAGRLQSRRDAHSDVVRLSRLLEGSNRALAH